MFKWVELITFTFSNGKLYVEAGLFLYCGLYSRGMHWFVAGLMQIHPCYKKLSSLAGNYREVVEDV